MTASPTADVVIVGAGLAGLRCAHLLSAGGLRVQIVEASDGVGGRVRTDRVAGFQLDRGFQVFNDAYPEAQACLNFGALDLYALESSLTVRAGGRLETIGNPLQAPTQALALVGTPLLSLPQKARLGAYAASAVMGSTKMLKRRVDTESIRAWRDHGFSDQTIDQVLTPFFSGVLLETSITSTRRFTDLMMRMFARGRSTLPKNGMQAIPEQLRSQCGADLAFETEALAVTGRSVSTSSGEIGARAVVVATDPWVASRLLPGLGQPPRAKGVTTVYHSVPRWNGQASRLIVDADGSGIVNTIVVSPSAPSYAPAGRALLASSVLHEARSDDAPDEWLLPQLAQLHEQPTQDWERLAHYSIPHALPAMDPPYPLRKSVRVEHESDLVYVAGDHRDTASIQGALVSGRRAAEAVLLDLA